MNLSLQSAPAPAPVPEIAKQWIGHAVSTYSFERPAADGEEPLHPPRADTFGKFFDKYVRGRDLPPVVTQERRFVVGDQLVGSAEGYAGFWNAVHAASSLSRGEHAPSVVVLHQPGDDRYYCMTMDADMAVRDVKAPTTEHVEDVDVTPYMPSQVLIDNIDSGAGLPPETLFAQGMYHRAPIAAVVAGRTLLGIQQDLRVFGGAAGG